MSASPIVLATDFGTADPYVGMMRGVIARINPDAAVIDLTHGITPQDVRHGAVVLADSHRYFPPGSIFVAVVDPGVGTDRAAILLEMPSARFLAPDNGLLTLVCREHDRGFGQAQTAVASEVPPGCAAWRLTNPDYWQHPISATFHGRDVFAPAAAHLSRGVSPDEMGECVSAMMALSMPSPRPEGKRVTGQVIYADHFGNLVTDITTDILANLGASLGDADVEILVAGRTIRGLSRTFHDPGGRELRALPGSQDRLEIAVVDGSAANLLGASSGVPIVVTVRR